MASFLSRFEVLYSLPQKITPALPVLWSLGVVLYLASAAFYYLLIALQRAQVAEAEQLQLRMLAQEAKLKALRAQLNPHFLFNSLNSISALTTVDSKRAREMCLLLSDFLRKSLGLGERKQVALREELDLARGLVREHLQGHPEIKILAECANGFEAVKAATEQSPDLLFLDIQMPKLDGFEVLELLDPQPAIVFITAFDQFAIKAFEAHAVDYLLKPFSETRFEEALAKAKAKCLAGELSVSRPAELSAAAREKWPLERIVVRDGSKVTFISLDKLDYVQAQDDYVELKTEGRSYLKQQTLSSLENQLDPQRFLRVHRSFILPLDRLARLEQGLTDSWTAILRDGAKLPVSKSGYAKLKELIG